MKVGYRQAGVVVLAVWAGTGTLWAQAAATPAAVAAPTPAGKVLTLGGDDNYTQQTLTVGDKVIVKLAADRAEGYLWKVAAAEPTILQLDAVQPKVPYSKQAFEFTAAGPGVTTLVINNMKKGATEPSQVYQVMLAVSSPPGQAKPTYVVGKYVGTLPCADCDGIEQTITFYSAGPNQFVDTLYKRTLKYQGKEGKIEDSGTWVLLPGTAADPSAQVYTLTPNGKTTQEYFWHRSAEELVPLDSSKKPVVASVDETLQLQK